MSEIVLTGLNGSNPLGYLAALGTLCALDSLYTHQNARLRWDINTWFAIIGLDKNLTTEKLVDDLYASLVRSESGNEVEIKKAQKAYEEAKTKTRKKMEEIKKRKPTKEDRKRAEQEELLPFVEMEQRFKQQWLKLKENTADKIVSLDKNLTVSPVQFREFCMRAAESCGPQNRRWADFCVAYGSEVITDEKGKRIKSSPFALITGSGHQDFLESAEALMKVCEKSHVEEALFGPWKYKDLMYSFRWDPIEDRRYALLAEDPTAIGNKPRTVWGANRLAFEALPLFPSVPEGRLLQTAGWERDGKDNTWFWPLWEPSVSLNTIRVLLTLPLSDPASRTELNPRGIFTVLKSNRIRWGFGPNVKFNLTPAVPFW